MDEESGARYAARLRKSLDELNRGAEIEEIVGGYSEDVVVLIPAAKPGDPVREAMFYGRAGLGDCLRRHVATLSPLRALGLTMGSPTHAVATIACRGGRQMTYEVEFDQTGLGRRVTISLV